MKLRRIDIHGFKSFRSKTALEIADGVTTVVGPNGCGKSNIVDAIRWSIGSQSAKDLRGRAMEDVIFAGSEHHKPMGLAEVSLTLENDGTAEVPVEWRDQAEFKVTRRLYRTGESEYEINGNKVRLRDIHELFLGTGVGSKEAYSIIEQGRIGFIVSARPEERRTIIEEAAGITRYKFQRKTAERRLEKTRDNLTRLRDILSEVERQVASLERQAKRAARYRELSTRRRRLEITAAIARRDQIEASTATAAGALEEARAGWRIESLGLKGVEERAERARVELAVRERNLNEITEEMYRARAKADLLATNVRHLETERATLDERLTRTRSDEEEQRSFISLSREAIDEARTNIASLEAETAGIEQTLASQQQALDAAREREAKAHGASRELSEALTRHRGELASSSGRLESAEAELHRLRGTLQSLDEGARERDEALRRAIDAEAEASTRRADSADAAAEAERAFDATRAAEQKANEAAQEAQREQRRTTSALRQASAELEALASVLGSGRGYAGGVRALHQAATRGQIDVSVRTVAECLRVDAERQQFVASALGPWLGAVVVADADAAASIVAWACQRNETLAVAVLDAPMTGALIDGVVAVEPVPAEVARRLRETASVDDVARHIGAAVDARRVVRSADGLIAVGGSGAEAEAMLRMTREHDALQASVQLRRAEATAADEAAEAAAHALEAAVAARSEQRRQLDELRRVADQAARAAAEAEAQRARAESVQTRASADAGAVRDRVTTLESSTAALRISRDTLADDIGALEASWTAAEQGLEQARAEVRTAQETWNATRVRHAETRERLAGLQRSQDRLGETARSAMERVERLAGELEQLVARRAELDENMAREREGAEQAAAERAALEIRHEETRTAWEKAQRGGREMEAELLAIRRRADEAGEKLRAAELHMERARADLEHAEQAVFERFEMTVAAARREAIEGGFNDRLSEELKELRTKLDRIGPVNPAAEQEFVEASERQEFLSTQKADLEAAMADLEAAIRRMDKTSRDLFAEMYEAVNERFQAIFPRMFRGGKARLELTQPDNLLETGIDIIVQPPGKRLQSMTLLSGGEKAMSAVALIFAIFQLKPTPFCVLDEVDAPLDEGNVTRFADMVVEMSAISQFLIITHNKRTMEAAQTLYGVTMEEPGVSKIVGVRLHDDERPSAAPG